MEAQEIAIRLGVAVLFGSLIGFERQWLQRMAGLRTNSLVAVGAAGFVVFSAMVSGDNSRTRMAAQVVSGIGFLGAGVILREGINVTGLNTAATLVVLGDGRNLRRRRTARRQRNRRRVRRPDEPVPAP